VRKHPTHIHYHSTSSWQIKKARKEESKTSSASLGSPASRRRQREKLHEPPALEAALSAAVVSGNSLNSLTTLFLSRSHWACAPVLQLWIPNVLLTCPLGINKLTSSRLSEGNLSVENEEGIKGAESKEQTPILSPKHRTYTAYRIWGFSRLFPPWTSEAACIWLGAAQSERPMVRLCPQHKFILKLAGLFLWEGQYGTEKERGKGGKLFFTLVLFWMWTICAPSWSAGDGLALEPHHIYRSKHKWLLPDCFMIH